MRPPAVTAGHVRSPSDAWTVRGTRVTPDPLNPAGPEARLTSGAPSGSHRGVAQLAEHRSPKPEVAGSSPVSPARPLKLFITGEPGSGKTTLLRKVAAEIQDRVPIRGFFTEEIRSGTTRDGFRGVTFDGRTFSLAHRGTGSLRVGAYSVDLTGLETVGLAALVPQRDTRIVIVDEIGKMELLSPRFRTAVEELLASDLPVLATIALHGVGIVKRLRHDPRVTLLRVRPDSQHGLVGEILRRLAAEGVVPPKSRS